MHICQWDCWVNCVSENTCFLLKKYLSLYTEIFSGRNLYMSYNIIENKKINTENVNLCYDNRFKLSHNYVENRQKELFLESASEQNVRQEMKFKGKRSNETKQLTAIYRILSPFILTIHNVCHVYFWFSSDVNNNKTHINVFFLKMTTNLFLLFWKRKK